MRTRLVPLAIKLRVEPFQGRGRAEILAGRLREGRLQTVAHDRQIQIEEFLFQGYHRIPFRIAE